ncbi:MAG: CopD family protein [Bacteroidetes bacterium]|nr:CopD family protein [Bacteroidota bacterium]
MLTVYLVSVFIHILCAVIWLGGLVLLLLVWLPAHSEMPHWIAKGDMVFRRVAWYAFAGLVVTGIYNVLARGWSWSDLIGLSFWQSAFGQTLAVKLLLFALILGISAWYDFVIGPRLLELGRGADKELQEMRRRAKILCQCNFALGLAVLICAIMLVRGRPF